MLDTQVQELARSMIQVQFQERREQIRQDVGMVNADMAARGLGRTGITVSRIHKLCAREVEVRALIVWQVLYRVLMNIGVQPSDTLAADLKAEVESYLPLPLSDLTQIVVDTARAMGVQPPPTLTEARTNALKKINAEIDLFVLSLRRQAEVRAGSPATTLHFYSPVGVVQTGPNATSSIIQNVNTSDKEALLEALDLAKQSLEKLNDVAGYSKDEILALLEESRLEIQKPKPNGMKLRTILTSIGTSIQTVNTLNQAYQALKAALLPWGIFLP